MKKLSTRTVQCSVPCVQENRATVQKKLQGKFSKTFPCLAKFTLQNKKIIIKYIRPYNTKYFNYNLKR